MTRIEGQNYTQLTRLNIIESLLLRGVPVVALNNIVIVDSAEKLSGELNSDALYFIDGVIDMGDTSIIVPQGGLHLAGLGFSISGLVSSQSDYTMMMDDSIYSGDLFVEVCI